MCPSMQELICCAGESFVRLHLHVGVRAAFAGVAHGPAFALVARVIAGRRWVCASAWAAEAVCERPGSPAGLQCALCPRGVVRLRPGAERGGYWSTLRKRPFKRGGRAAHVSTSTAAPACGGEVGGCSGGVQRLRNLGGRRGARAERDCGPNALRKECRCFARVSAGALPQGEPRVLFSCTRLGRGWLECSSITADGAAFAWGEGQFGCLGHGEDMSNQLLPKKLEVWALRG